MKSVIALSSNKMYELSHYPSYLLGILVNIQVVVLNVNLT